MEKFFKFLFLGAFALFAFASCTDEKDEPNNNGSGTHDDSYYAADAYISSDDSRFTSTSDGGTIAFKAEGGTVVVNVICGTDWVVENSAADILTSTIVSATTLNLTMDQNTVEETRSATISVLTATQRIKFATINITQNAYGAPEITVDLDTWTFPAVSTTQLVKEIGVNATLGTWEVENNVDWLTVQSSDASVTLTAAQNDDPEERSTRITLTSSDGFRSDYATIRVYQDARASIVLDKDALTFYVSGEKVTVGVESNYEWDFSYDSTNGWFKAERDENNIVVTTTAENETEGNYEGIITVTAGDGAENVISTQISVTEMPASAAEDALVLDYTVTLTNLEITLPIVGTNCTVNWGDGVSETVTKDNPTHTYAAAGSYVVRVNGTVTGLSCQDFSSSSNPETALTAVEQWGHTGLRTMDYAFYYCSNLKTIPTDSDGAFAEVKNFDNAFTRTAITSIPEHFFDYATKCTSFYFTFFYAKITAIPTDLFKYNTEATDFSAVFRNTSISTIPEDVFKYNTKAELMEQVFYGMPIRTIPENVFANCPLVTSFSDAFETCSSLTEIPADLFKYNTKVENFKACFYSCTKLTAIPLGLFDSCTEATNFRSCFAYNGTLTVPNGLFRNCIAGEDFYALFQKNTGIIWTGFQNADGSWTEEGLFTNTNAQDFSYMFYQTENETVPANLFKGCTKATNFERLFYNNSTITDFPEGLFDDCVAAENFNYAFRQNTAVTEYHPNMFKGCPNIASLTQAFRANTHLTCETPYDVWEINGVETHIHLYDRENYPDLYTAPTTHDNCFYDTGNFSDYSSIPSGWR